MSNYRRDPYAPQGDPYARSSRQDPYASSSQYAPKREREYDYDRDSKRPRYPGQQQPRAQFDPYSRQQEASYNDQYRARARDDYSRQDYRAQPSYGYDARRPDERYGAQDPYGRREGTYGRGVSNGGGYDDRRNQYDSRSSGYDYARADYSRRQDDRYMNRGYDERYASGGGYDRQGYDRQSFDRQGYDRRQSGGYGGYGSNNNRDNGGFRGRGYGGGGGYDNGGGYGGGGRGGRGRGGRGRGGRGRGRGRGGRGGGRGGEKEKPQAYIPNFAEDLEMAIAERNFRMPDHDKRLDGPDFEIPDNPESMFAEPTEDAPVDSSVAQLEVDPDEESCSIMVSGFPNDGPMHKLVDYFKSMASLRKAPEKMDEGTIKLAFNRKKDVPFVVKWFKDPEKAQINACTVKVHAVNPEVMAT